MSESEIFEKIQLIIEDKLDLPKDKIKFDSSFKGDLKADSLDAYEIIYAIEEEFGVQIPDEQVNTMEKISDAVNFIHSKKS